jgi:hypothetical protein
MTPSGGYELPGERIRDARAVRAWFQLAKATTCIERARELLADVDESQLDENRFFRLRALQWTLRTELNALAAPFDADEKRRTSVAVNNPPRTT